MRAAQASNSLHSPSRSTPAGAGGSVVRGRAAPSGVREAASRSSVQRELRSKSQRSRTCSMPTFTRQYLALTSGEGKCGEEKTGVARMAGPLGFEAQ